jgi:hypothetical protein
MAALEFATRSDLTPRQGATLDNLPTNWEVIGRIDSDAANTIDMMMPDLYDPPPTLLLVRDPTGTDWQIDREGNLKISERRSRRERIPLQPMLNELASLSEGR